MIGLDDDPFGTATATAAAAPLKARAPKPPEPQPYFEPIVFTIHGEPASKANSREVVKFNDMVRVVKSKKAQAYERDALKQIPPKARVRMSGPVRVTLRIFYASERPDLDESVVLDVMQDRYAKQKVQGADEKVRVLIQAGVYRNDRQVREKHVFHSIDRLMPRTEVRIESLEPQGALL